MKKRHEIDIADVAGFRHTYSLASGPGAHDHRKDLVLVVEGDEVTYDVKRRDGVASTGFSTLAAAVAAYNEL